MYIFIRSLLFLLPPEIAHFLALKILAITPSWIFKKPNHNPTNVMGITFPHKIGLAAGFDKNGEHLAAIAKLGFAFIEVGTVTPKPQPGNRKPRLFRLIKKQALINRMGFNNDGVDKLIMNIKNSNYKGVLGINIGKNKDTSLDLAHNDYIYCMQRVYNLADYIAINISSPNTENLRKLQSQSYFDEFIAKLVVQHKKLVIKYNKYVPLVIKVSPDESKEVLKNIANIAIKYNLDGIIATNTSNMQLSSNQAAGGLSGKPILRLANDTLAYLKTIVGDKLCLIGVGGVHDELSAQSKLACGASLIQIYTGFIYQGPKLLRICLNSR